MYYGKTRYKKGKILGSQLMLEENEEKKKLEYDIEIKNGTKIAFLEIKKIFEILNYGKKNIMKFVIFNKKKKEY